MTWRFTVRSVPIAVPPMHHIEGRATRDGFIIDTPRDQIPDSWAGREVRVRFSFPASERALVDESLIRASFAGALRLELEPVAVPDRALRAPEVATAKTLAEKVNAWARLDGSSRSVPASVLQKLAALEHSDSTAVLSDVANQVASLEQGQKCEVAA